MGNEVKQLLAFGACRVDIEQRLLFRDEKPIPLSPKSFDLLIVLVQRSGQVVLKDDLMKVLWPDTFVEESNLSQHVFQLRKALGDPSYIATVPGRGYRFAEKVRTLEDDILLESHRRSRIVIKELGSPTGAPAALLKYWRAGVAILAVVIAAGTVAAYFSTHRAARLTSKDTLVLADFVNSTGDPVFDDTLRTALGIALAQSPFLNILSDNKTQATLRLMTRAADTKISPDLAREICQRAGGKAYIASSIARLGSQYVLTLEALACQSGDTMARQQLTASAKEKVLDTLGNAASALRTHLGESLDTVQKFDVSLPQATTPSLEALKAYSLGEKFLYYKDSAAAPPYFQHALELDPNFAMAYEELGNAYFSLNELGRSREYFAKAFALRERTSELERLHIAAEYYGYATGELYKALDALQEDIEYKDSSVYLGLADVYTRLGQYEKSEQTARTILALDPRGNFGFVDSALADLALQNLNGARQIIQQAQQQGIESPFLHVNLYTLSFLQADSAGMAEQQRWFAAQHMYENQGLALAADTEAYVGHLKKARELTALATDSAMRADNGEDAAMYRANHALAEAAYGNVAEARELATGAVSMAPDQPGVAIQAAIAFAMIRETSRASSLAREFGKQFPLDTQLQLLGLPAIQAQLQLGERRPDLALNTLRTGLPIEFANTTFTSINTSCLYPTYIRGQAFLAAGQGTAAAGEFHKIIDHGGIVGNCWTGALAHLGLGRAYTLQSATSQGDQAVAARAQAVGAYERFLALWKDADPDIPILKQARTEYAKLR